MVKVIIDGSKMLTGKSAHEEISLAMGFPDYYGANLDAMWDILSTVGEDTEITLINAAAMKAALGEYGESIIAVIGEAAGENAFLSFIVED